MPWFPMASQGRELLLRFLRTPLRLNRGASSRVWVLYNIRIIAKPVVSIPLEFAKIQFHLAVDIRKRVLIYLIGMLGYKP